MIDLSKIETLKKKSVAERIQIIEIILQSLKNDIKAAAPQPTPQVEPFTVDTFSLGEDVHVNREELYAGRGL